MTGIICWLLLAYMLVVFVHVIFSWIPSPPEELRGIQRGAARMVEPVVAPIRRGLPPLRMGNLALDVSIIILFLALIILRAIFCG